MKVLTVKDLTTGDLIKIKSGRFNPDLHEKLDEAQVVEKVEEEETEEEVAVENLCIECSKAFKTPAALKAHITINHKKDDEPV